MNCLKLCDGNDCYQTENDSRVYHIDYETAEFLRKHCSTWMNGSYDDICLDCIENTNADYEDFFTVNDYDLHVNLGYLENPSLLD